MTANPIPALIYALLLAIGVIAPYAARQFGWKVAADRDERWLPLLLVGGGLVITVFRGGLLLEGAALLLISSLGYGRWQLAGALAAVMLFSTTTWWLGGASISTAQKILFTAICLMLALIARRTQFTKSAVPTKIGADLIAVCLLLLVGTIAGLLSGAVNATQSALTTWHHWGAYLSPVESLISGGVPFRDFPLQYGMGPTLVISAVCGKNCWSGIYVATVMSNALYLALFGWSVLVLTRGMDRGARLLALGAMMCAVFLWTGAPADWGSPLMVPSVAGMRFLPLVMLVAYILTVETNATLSKSQLWCGHGLWLLGLFWSPEGGFFASLVWWPYLVLRDAEVRYGWGALFLGGLRGLAALIVGYTVLAILFRVTFGDWVALGDFLLYLRYPPGPLPVTLLGPVWFVVAVLMLAVLAAVLHSTHREGRSLCVCLLATLGSLSYYLSRSHDNNILNLLPFLVLLLVATQATRQTPFGTAVVRTTLIAVIAFVSAFNFHQWTTTPNYSVAGVQVGGSAFFDRFVPSTHQPATLVPHDAARAFDDLYRLGAGQILLFDPRRVMVVSPPGPHWTGVNNSANFDPLPNAIILHYIRRGAAVYHRPGWIVIHRAQAGDSHWLPLFRVIYDVDAQRDYGTYVAFHLTPKPKP